jgi:DNA-binding MarR family transcriptional regulator
MTKQQSSLKAIWYGLEAKKFTAVPNTFLDHAAKWGLKMAHVVLVFHLLKYKWTPEHPFPSISTLAAEMGVDARTVRGWIEDLEKLGLLRRIARQKKNGERSSNAYDLTPLFDRLKEIPESIVEVFGEAVIEDGPANDDAESDPVEEQPQVGQVAEPVVAEEPITEATKELTIQTGRDQYVVTLEELSGAYNWALGEAMTVLHYNVAKRGRISDEYDRVRLFEEVRKAAVEKKDQDLAGREIVKYAMWRIFERQVEGAQAQVA